MPSYGAGGVVYRRMGSAASLSLGTWRSGERSDSRRVLQGKEASLGEEDNQGEHARAQEGINVVQSSGRTHGIILIL